MKHLAIVIVTLSLFSNLLAHSGGTNSSGCHTNKKTGDYHCHKSKVQTNSYKVKKTTDSSKVTSCCKICKKGKACGNSCISRSYNCTKSKGCACDG